MGARTAIAVKLDRPDDPSWYNRPPYTVCERVLDEYDVEACRLPGEVPDG